MIDMSKTVTVTRTGLTVVHGFKEASQMFAFGKILLLRKDRCIVLVSAGPQKGKKIDMPLTFPQMVGDTIYHVDAPAEEVAAQEEAKLKRAKPAPGETKMDKCKAIFAANPTLDKEAMKALFVKDAGCTPAGANTYYITIKKAT